MRVLCLASSLRADSRTSAMMAVAAAVVEEAGHEADRLDLKDVAMEFCDGRPLEEYGEGMRAAAARLEAADAYVIGMPIYCYSVPGVLKNFLDVACRGMHDKPFAVLAVGGGERSFLACADLQKILLYEVRGRPYAPVLYASDRHFHGPTPTEDTSNRIRAIVRDFCAWASASAPRRQAT
jgi:NAD(P)H-dependent FMN reductase